VVRELIFRVCCTSKFFSVKQRLVWVYFSERGLVLALFTCHTRSLLLVTHIHSYASLQRQILGRLVSFYASAISCK